MWWLIKTSAISITVIFIVHYLIRFFVSTMTVPKIKDLVSLSQQQFDMMSAAKNEGTTPELAGGTTHDSDSALLDSSGSGSGLKSFLKRVSERPVEASNLISMSDYASF
jgi:hypothetical protein